MSRTFSTPARSLLQIIWKNTERVAKYDDIIMKSVEDNPKLKSKAEKIEVAYKNLLSFLQSLS
ncbi:uncharacterized protein BO66DRAFT_56185 [Aspergillus aculeatinus CBS 121060]|uniref:Uncharacterized protein n=1 Tax=Aspergillus aculeatinus CBS 121060 TaxID=1448322 RepID=A0ACD1HCP9_9EURO|nr:hypothetical protein BO66DRAFT_56185 [Aspergillus aculeatinus CBS 121060]RAH71349.1 hypothetical protein BO66DRAFT_56185 [Aspergillus aculeatinus CBS 121060]